MAKAVAGTRSGWLVLVSVLLGLGGCRQMAEGTDREVSAIIAERQRAALGKAWPPAVPPEDDHLAPPGKRAYSYAPHPVSPEVPKGFEPTMPAETQPATLPADPMPETTSPGPPSTAPTTLPPATTQASTAPAAEDQAPSTQPVRVFTLTDALAYAQRHQREYQTAKEDLYLAALSLTLERHLWTPIFAANLKTVYGNFGEVRDFDQAMRFVADLSVSQRLPYGGEFTAQAISTLIRDVGKTITAEEGSTIKLEVTVPFLRNAGHVAKEKLIQLERELTYAVRDFERFRRRQLVQVAQSYFNLLRTKQTVLDNEQSAKRRGEIYRRAMEFQKRELGSLLDMQRAEFEYLSAQNRLERSREAFRAEADRFKLLIGMPVDEPLGLENLEDIESIERQVAEGKYPLLLPSPSMTDEQRALQVATQNRLDLLNRADLIDDARRGVAIARNALLPDLDLSASVTWDTEPEHYRLGGFTFDRTTWRSELTLGLPLERTSERNRFRQALISVRRAQREYHDQLERIRAEVRAAINQIRLENRSLEIQLKNLEVVEKRLKYAEIRYNEGDIDVREYQDAEDAWTSARNALNLAKTSRWSALLEFRLATETLRVDENGVQHPPPDLEPQIPAGKGSSDLK